LSPPRPITVDHDPQIDVLRQAADQMVRALSAVPPPNTCRTWQSVQLDGGDRRKRLDDVEIFFDQRRARQPAGHEL